MQNSGHLDYTEHSNIPPLAVEGENIAQEIKKCKVLGNLLEKEVANFEDHCSPQVQDLVNEEIWISSSNPFRHKTKLYCVELRPKSLLSG